MMQQPTPEDFVRTLIDYAGQSVVAEAFREIHTDGLEEEKIRSDYKAFFYRCFATLNPATTYLHNWHIDIICEYLEACRLGQITRLQINIPPRYLKSSLCTIAFPAWLLGHNPSEQIMCASHSKSLALEHSVATRTILQSVWYKKIFKRTALSIKQDRKFTTTRRGHRIAVSTGSSTIGMGGNFLIADDLIDPEKAFSEQHRHVANRYYDQSFSTRLNDKKKGVIIIIMQRLHEDDTCGHTLGQEDWTRLVIPAIAPEKKIYSFGTFNKMVLPKELLHENREDEEDLITAKKRLGSYGFSGQYQQQPTPEEGGIIQMNWFKRYKELPVRDSSNMVLQIWDTAQKDNEVVNAPWVCGTWLITYTHYYLAHVFRDWLNYPDGKKKVKQLYDKWKPQGVVIEDKSTGSSLLQELEGIPTIPYEPEGDKLTRLSVESPVVEGGMVVLPEEADWLYDFEHEIKLFPNSTYADQADMLSCFLRYIRTKQINMDNLILGQAHETFQNI